MAIRFVCGSTADASLSGFRRRSLSENVLAPVATGDQRETHINTAYFARAGEWSLRHYSCPDARHSRNLLQNALMSVALCDSHQT